LSLGGDVAERHAQKMTAEGGKSGKTDDRRKEKENGIVEVAESR